MTTNCEALQGVRTEAIIHEVYLRPVLWDASCEEFAYKTKKRAAWDEVCRALYPNFDGFHVDKQIEIGEALRKKWKNLRTCFSREVRRSKAPDAHLHKKYLYSDAMAFLLPEIQNSCDSNTDFSEIATSPSVEDIEVEEDDDNKVKKVKIEEPEYQESEVAVLDENPDVEMKPDVEQELGGGSDVHRLPEEPGPSENSSAQAGHGKKDASNQSNSENSEQKSAVNHNASAQTSKNKVTQTYSQIPSVPPFSKSSNGCVWRQNYSLRQRKAQSPRGASMNSSCRESVSSPMPNHEDRLFLLSLVKDLSEVPSDRKLQAKCEIMGVISKYKNPSNVHFMFPYTFASTGYPPSIICPQQPAQQQKPPPPPTQQQQQQQKLMLQPKTRRTVQRKHLENTNVTYVSSDASDVSDSCDV